MRAVGSNASRSLDSGQLLRGRIESLCSDFATRLSDEVGRAAVSTLARTERAAVAETARALEEVAAAMRKIRSADHAAAVLTQLVDAVPVFCRRAVLLLRSGDRMIGFHSAGPPARPALGGREQLSFEISSAPSIRRAVETKLKVDAKGAQRDISHRLSTEMAYADDEDVRVVPVVLRNTVIGVLLVDGEPIQDSAIETLVLASEAWIEALGSRSDSKQGGEANLA